MAYARIKTWVAEILTYAELNAEFDGCITNENALLTALNAEIATRGTLQTAVQAISRGTLGAATEIDMATLYAADAEASDTYVITLAPVPAAYYAGMVISFKANTVNTGACTINVNTLGAKSIVKRFNVALDTADIKAGQFVQLIYDGTNFQIISPTSGGAGIKIGTYAGDGSTSQAITGIGAKPKYVRIFRHPTASEDTEVWEVLDYSWGTRSIIMSSTATDEVQVLLNQIISIDADGFTVDDAGADSGPNANGINYDYMVLF